MSMAKALNRLAGSFPERSSLTSSALVATATSRGLPRFVPHTEMPEGMAYEAFIHNECAVPTRENWHDGFNALCWMRMPALKWHFNQLQAEVIARDGIQARRGPVRDAITVFDENGAFLQASDELWAAIVARDWERAFVGLRAHWSPCRWLVAGHALLDNLTRPFKGITAHVLRWPCDWGADEQDLAQGMVQHLSSEVLAHKPFTPLPVMGIPGWMAGQDEPAFFADKNVFRSKRVRA